MRTRRGLAARRSAGRALPDVCPQRHRGAGFVAGSVLGHSPTGGAEKCQTCPRRCRGACPGARAVAGLGGRWPLCPAVSRCGGLRLCNARRRSADRCGICRLGAECFRPPARSGGRPMTRTSQAADPLTHPLTGQSLVESSAGTGKTTMLVRLYLRALLLDGRMLSEILAVTYTRAATGELSVRIRKGLLEAGKNLASPTGFWADFFADADKDQVRKRIDAALAGFDDKGVFTIHGFCQRMLSDHAFEARSAFASEEIEDESGLREEVAADFWRHRVARDDPAYVRWFVATFASPRELLRGPLRQPLQVSGELTIKPTVSESDVEAARERFEQAARTARDGWRKDAKTLRAWIGESDDLDRGKYPKTTTARMLDDWARWLEAPPALKLPENFDRLTREKASQCLKRGAVPETAFFNRDCAAKLLAARDGLHAAWWQETVRAAFAYVRREFSERKKAQRERGFDDMLRELHDALREACLARRIAKQFPLIL